MTPRRQKVEVVAKISRIDFGEGKGINMKNGKSGGKMSTWLRDQKEDQICVTEVAVDNIL